MGLAPPRPAHWKATVDGKLTYACALHYERLKLATFVAITDIEHAKEHLPQQVPASERDSAGAWCGYCTETTKERT